MKTILGLCLLALGTSACGNSLNCQVYGDNVRGRIRFAPTIQIDTTTRIVVEWTKDDFANIGGRSVLNDLHGLPDVPYSFCADNAVPLEFRAYQDKGGNLVLDSGDPHGRYDGTTNGDAAYIQKTIPEPSSSSSSSNTKDWPTIDAIDITIDNP